MKKFTVLVALALLAATGASYAVTCSQDNVPGATLLVPYFKVSRNGATINSAEIPDGGVDTLVAITNVSEWGVISHWTVWNKQSAPVVDFNVPLTGYDVAYTSMRRILNGHLNINPYTQNANGGVDPCKDTLNIGDSQLQFMRFLHPDAPNGTDYQNSIAFYADPAFTGGFKQKIWDSLDEGADYADLATRPANDKDNPACGVTSDGALSGDFVGYVTIDVVNYCTNWFQAQETFFTKDAIATLGWDGNGGPNVLMGDVFFVDPNAAAGNISGDTAIALEFDTRLEAPAAWNTSTYRTFYARYSNFPFGTSVAIADNTIDPNVPPAYAFIGDGREPLGTSYGFRYMNQAPAGVSWVTVFRSDVWDRDNSSATATTPVGNLCLIRDNGREMGLRIWDNDENECGIDPYIGGGSGGGPSGDEPGPCYNPVNVWWETNRIAVAGNLSMNAFDYKGGWTAWTFNRNNPSDRYHQAWVGIEHTAPGAFVSVGHSATLLDNQFLCPEVLGFGGNIAYGAVAE